MTTEATNESPVVRARAPNPFPWSALDAISKDDASAFRKARRWLATLGDEALVARTVESLTGATVSIRLRSVGTGPLTTPHVVALDLAPVDERSFGLSLQVESGLAVAIVARAVRRKAPRLFDPDLRPTDALVGAFAAVVGAALSRVQAKASHLLRASRSSPREGTSSPAVRRIAFTVVIDDEAFVAHLVVPDHVLPFVPKPPFELSDLEALDRCPIALPLIGATSLASAADLDALNVGDVFMPESFTFSRAPSSAHGGQLAFTGELALVSPSNERGLGVRIDTEGLLRLRGDDVLLSWHSSGPPIMSEAPTDSSQETAVTRAVAEAPVVVRVEVGSVTLTASEWASLRPGDVLSTGHPIASPVVLRAGGVEVARGELVEIEGELGVRIRSRSLEVSK